MNIIFAIYFNRSVSSYFFKAFKDNNIYIYIKIVNEYQILKKKYFQIGIKVFYCEPNDTEIKIGFYKDSSFNKDEILEYKFSNEICKEIYIGRDDICNIKFKENNYLSKIHCCVSWDDVRKGWNIMDGNGREASTNGTWLFCNEKYHIKDKETFCKINKSVFVIKKEESVNCSNKYNESAYESSK